MRFSPLVLTAVFLSACGGTAAQDETVETTPPIGLPGGGTPTGSTDCPGGTDCTTTTTTTSSAPCLDAKTFYMHYAIAWDGSASVPSMTDDAGTVLQSAFEFTAGPSGWDGDASVPGPGNWCFVRFNTSGLTSGDTSDGEFAVLTGFGGSITNCGQESTPGAGDAIELCPGSLLDMYEPASIVGDPLEWTADIGGHAITPENQDLHDGLIANGDYTQDNFWGGSLANAFFPDQPFTVSWSGLVADGVGVLGDPVNGYERHVAADQGPGALLPGYYASHLVWNVTFQ